VFFCKLVKIFLESKEAIRYFFGKLWAILWAKVNFFEKFFYKKVENKERVV